MVSQRSSRRTKIEHKDGATVKLGFTYALDDNGNITETTEQDGTYWDYAYDARNRLTSWRVLFTQSESS